VRTATEPPTTLTDIEATFNALVEIHPKRSGKGNMVSIPAAGAYATDEQDRTRLAEFWEFNRKLIHGEYRAVVEGRGIPTSR
jgi:hypothetical protein